MVERLQTQSPPIAAPPAAAVDAIDAFVRRHQTGLWRFLRVLGCRGQRAEEIAQDALVVALGRGQQHEPPAAAAAFLRQTAKHLWLREQRADRRRAVRHAAAAEALWTRQLARDDGDSWLQALDECVAQLPERSRRALDLAYRDGLCRQQLAQALGLGEHGARTLLQRLRARLRDCIERRRR